MKNASARLKLSIVAPVALIGAVILAAVWLDVTTGGEAEPLPLLGAIGTPVRGTFVPPTATPPGFAPTPRPRPTPAGATGTPEERDAKRRRDVLIILDGLAQLRRRDGEYPSTGGNLQSFCVYREIDAGCKVKDVTGADAPQDPLGNAPEHGYKYASDGRTATIYVAFEGDIPAEQRCDKDNVGFEDNQSVICPTLP
jgi:hypothetical protein